MDLSNWYLCHNLSLSGKLFSPCCLSLLYSKIEYSNIYNTPISDLKNNINVPYGFITPRSVSSVIIAPLIRKGMDVGFGVQNTEFLPDDQKEHILKMSSVELKFEEIRREVSPEAPSRLSCLWLAENTAEGRNHIQNMLGDSIYIFKVKILLKIRLSKADTKWFDEYCLKPNKDYIENYWNSIPYHDESATWEYLLEGAIEMVDDKELKYIQENSEKILYE